MHSKKKNCVVTVLVVVVLFPFVCLFYFFLQACVLLKSVQTVCNELEKKILVIEIFSH